MLHNGRLFKEGAREIDSDDEVQSFTSGAAVADRFATRPTGPPVL